MRQKPYDKYVSITLDWNGKPFVLELLWNGEPTFCQKCGQQIGWGLSAKRKWIPFDLPEARRSHFDTCRPKQIDDPEL